MTTQKQKKNTKNVIVLLLSSVLLVSTIIATQFSSTLGTTKTAFAHNGVDHSAQSTVSTKIQVTNGTSRSVSPDFLDIPKEVSASGFRFYCRVSHFSYDDPIMAPNKPDAAHLHMYFGNTEAKANTTNDTLASQGNSSCTGGTINKSAYWMPAVLDENNKVVIPEFVKMYYKAHEDVANTQRVPNGLQLISSDKIQGCGDFAFDCTKIYELEGKLLIDMTMPNCLQVDGSGNPILSSADKYSHTAFGYFKCPDTHPYRIPMISNNYVYAISPSSNWKLSSDVVDPKNPLPKGSTAHADAFINWSDEGREAIFKCIRASQNCELWSTGDEDKNPAGQVVYEGMKYIADRTFLGVLPAMKDAMSHGSSSSSSSSLSSSEISSSLATSSSSASEQSSSSTSGQSSISSSSPSSATSSSIATSSASSATESSVTSSPVSSDSSTSSVFNSVSSSSSSQNLSSSSTSTSSSSSTSEIRQKRIKELREKIRQKILQRAELNRQIQQDNRELNALLRGRDPVVRN